MTSIEPSTVVVPVLCAIVLVGALRGRWVLCWLLAHEVGPATTERVASRPGRAEAVRVSRCVRCRRVFRG